MELSLRFDDNQTGHKDLVLRFAGRTRTADSYYLALDLGILPNQENANKFHIVLRRLLEQWVDAVELLPSGGTIYLPDDFSDQCTGWVRCQRSGNRIAVCRGWAELEGWSISPSAVGDLITNLQGFRADDPTVHVSADELVQAIRESMGAVGQSQSR